MLAVVLCLLLGVAIATQVRQTNSIDALSTARPADLMVLLDSLQRQEAVLNTEVAELQRNLAAMQAAGSGDQAAIRNAEARLAALAILAGTVAATGPGVTVTVTDPGPGVSAETMLDVLNELRAAGAETIEIRSGQQAVRVGVDTWVAGAAGGLVIDSQTLRPPYSIVAIGDPPTLAAALTIPGEPLTASSVSVGRSRWFNPNAWTSPPCGNRNRANTLSPSSSGRPEGAP